MVIADPFCSARNIQRFFQIANTYSLRTMSATNKLFAYGILMWPDVLEAVTGRCMTGEKMTLAGYKRLRAKDRHYPVMLRALKDSVSGVLYTGLTDDEFRCLDTFEGVEYERTEVALGAGAAFAYVLSNDWKHIADSKAWKPEQLTPEDLAMYCVQYTGWTKV